MAGRLHLGPSALVARDHCRPFALLCQATSANAADSALKSGKGSSTGNGWPPPSGRWPRPARGSAWPASHHGSRRLRVPLLPAASYRREPGVAVRGVRCDFRRPLMAPIDRPSRPRERAHMPAVGPTASLLALAGHVCRVVASLAKAFSIAEASRSYGAGSPMMPRRVVRLIDRCPKPSIDSRGNT